MGSAAGSGGRLPRMTHLVLLPSPLLGPASWAPVADELSRRGHRVAVPRLGARVATPADVLAGYLAGAPDEPGLVLVPHSNAGLYAAALAGERDVSAVVFVDALLPSDEATTPTAAGGFRDALGRLAGTDGVLPSWTSWWPEADTAGLFPDAATRTAVEREQPRLPLAYFDEQVPTPPGWRSVPSAYLAFGDAYAPERATAAARGWPTETLPGRHLHQLVDPVGVADAVLWLLTAARTGSPALRTRVKSGESDGTTTRGTSHRTRPAAD
jgi:hypothetical protein